MRRKGRLLRWETRYSERTLVMNKVKYIVVWVCSLHWGCSIEDISVKSLMSATQSWLVDFVGMLLLWSSRLWSFVAEGVDSTAGDEEIFDSRHSTSRLIRLLSNGVLSNPVVNRVLLDYSRLKQFESTDHLSRLDWQHRRSRPLWLLCRQWWLTRSKSLSRFEDEHELLRKFFEAITGLVLTDEFLQFFLSWFDVLLTEPLHGFSVFGVHIFYYFFFFRFAVDLIQLFLSSLHLFDKSLSNCFVYCVHRFCTISQIKVSSW